MTRTRAQRKMGFTGRLPFSTPKFPSFCLNPSRNNDGFSRTLLSAFFMFILYHIRVKEIKMTLSQKGAYLHAPFRMDSM